MPSGLSSIAVLPFVNMSADAEQEYFCDGMAEEIINALTKIDGLRVVARTSTFQFKGQALDLREVGKKLAATTVLEGSVRKAGDRLRVSARLIQVSDGSHMWSDTYDRQVDDVFAIQDEVSQAIRDVLRVKLLPAADTASPARPTEDMEAYRLYLQGPHHFHKHTEDGWAQAVDAFSRAIARDPSYAQPHVGLATTLWWTAFSGSTSPHEAYPKARRAALHALAIDESIGDAHSALAAVKTQYDWDWAGAKVEFNRAMELAPRSTDTLQAYSVYLLNLGWLDEAIAVTKREIELDPLFVKAHQDLGYEYYLARRFDESEAQLTATVELDPHHPPTYLCLAFTYLAQGRIVEAIAVTDRGSNLVGESPIYEAVRGWAYARGGRVEEARAILNRLEGEALRQHVSSVNLAWLHTGLGDSEKALDCLDRAYHERAVMLISLPTFLGWDPLRSDPRFHDLLRLMNFPQQP